MEAIGSATQNLRKLGHQVLQKAPTFALQFFSNCSTKLSKSVQILKNICGTNKEVVITASIVSAALLYLKIRKQQPEKTCIRKISQENTHQSSEEQILESIYDQRDSRKRIISTSYLKLADNSQIHSKTSLANNLQVVEEQSDSSEEDKMFFQIYRGYQKSE